MGAQAPGTPGFVFNHACDGRSGIPLPRGFAGLGVASRRRADSRVAAAAGGTRLPLGALLPFAAGILLIVGRAPSAEDPAAAAAAAATAAGAAAAGADDAEDAADASDTATAGSTASPAAESSS